MALQYMSSNCVIINWWCYEFSISSKSSTEALYHCKSFWCLLFKFWVSWLIWVGEQESWRKWEIHYLAGLEWASTISRLYRIQTQAPTPFPSRSKNLKISVKGPGGGFQLGVLCLWGKCNLNAFTNTTFAYYFCESLHVFCKGAECWKRWVHPENWPSK